MALELLVGTLHFFTVHCPVPVGLRFSPVYLLCLGILLCYQSPVYSPFISLLSGVCFFSCLFHIFSPNISLTTGRLSSVNDKSNLDIKCLPLCLSSVTVFRHGFPSCPTSLSLSLSLALSLSLSPSRFLSPSLSLSLAAPQNAMAINFVSVMVR